MNIMKQKECNLTKEQLLIELERAYRCICGFYTNACRGQLMEERTMTYHSPTIGAAMRSVMLDKMDGAEWFIGKNSDELNAALRLAITME